jgi:hypothetical protein
VIITTPLSCVFIVIITFWSHWEHFDLRRLISDKVEDILNKLKYALKKIWLGKVRQHLYVISEPQGKWSIMSKRWLYAHGTWTVHVLDPVRCVNTVRASVLCNCFPQNSDSKRGISSLIRCIAHSLRKGKELEQFLNLKIVILIFIRKLWTAIKLDIVFLRILLCCSNCQEPRTQWRWWNCNIRGLT